MKVKFQADADFNKIILDATIRTEPLIDFQTASAAGLSDLNDYEVLSVASKLVRVLVTHDQTTMPTHFANFIHTEQCAGVLIVPHLPANLVVKELILIWLATEAEEWLNRIAYLPL